MRSQTALGWCCYRGKTDMVKLLVENGADVNHQDDDGRTPLHWAARKGHLAIVEFLIDEGAGVDVRSLAKGETPLHKAAAQGHVPVVRLLLQSGADKHVKNCDGLTPLQIKRLFLKQFRRGEGIVAANKVIIRGGGKDVIVAAPTNSISTNQC